MTEQELARSVVDWLVAQHYDVYQEVQVDELGPIADIVVDVNGWGWVIECKTTFGLHVLGQAHRWQRLGVTRVSVATPTKGSSRAPAEMGAHVCSRFGIGRLSVVGSEVVEKHEPRFTRPPRWRRERDILRACHEGHRRCASAGSAQGGHWTPYRETMDGVRNFLEGRDWTPVREIVGEVKHHYNTGSTARSCLATNLRTIEAEKGWVEYRLNGRRGEFRLRKEPT